MYGKVTQQYIYKYIHFFYVLFHYWSSLCYTVGPYRLFILYRMYVYVNPKLLNSLMVKNVFGCR